MEKHRLAIEIDGAAPAQGPIFLRQTNENRIVASWLQVDLPGECESLVRISIWQAKQFQVAWQIATIIENLILIADFLQRDASLDEGCFKFQGAAIGVGKRHLDPADIAGCQCPPVQLGCTGLVEGFVLVEEIDRLGRYHLIVRQKGRPSQIT